MSSPDNDKWRRISPKSSKSSWLSIALTETGQEQPPQPVTAKRAQKSQHIISKKTQKKKRKPRQKNFSLSVPASSRSPKLHTVRKPARSSEPDLETLPRHSAG